MNAKDVNVLVSHRLAGPTILSDRLFPIGQATQHRQWNMNGYEWHVIEVLTAAIT